jgi:hypothetical protein
LRQSASREGKIVGSGFFCCSLLEAGFLAVDAGVNVVVFLLVKLAIGALVGVTLAEATAGSPTDLVVLLVAGADGEEEEEEEGAFDEVALGVAVPDSDAGCEGRAAVEGGLAGAWEDFAAGVPTAELVGAVVELFVLAGCDALSTPLLHFDLGLALRERQS